MASRFLGACLAVFLASAATTASAAGDAAKGEDVFGITCVGCHSVSGPSLAAPALAGVVGRKAGTAAGFQYSDALAKSGLVWNEQTLDKYLADPNAAVPGTTMPIGVSSAEDRANVIAYLKTLAPAH